MKKSARQAGFGKEMPPEKGHVTIYFIQKGLTEKEADFFFGQQKLTDWKTKRGRPIRNWKAVAAEWIWQLKQRRKNTENDK
ncbi:MAG: hypothetical protein JSU01_08630 [Bacteroidetes bacterium]|nr:hypothetical protein [Bacteroidota bacterium]